MDGRLDNKRYAGPVLGSKVDCIEAEVIAEKVTSELRGSNRRLIELPEELPGLGLTDTLRDVLSGDTRRALGLRETAVRSLARVAFSFRVRPWSAAMSSIEDILEEARQRGRQFKLELLQRSGGLLSANQAAARLGTASQALEAVTSLIALPTDGDVAGYPAFQFESHAMLEGIAKLLAAIQVDDPWSRLNFCFLRLQELNGRTPIEAIRAGEIDAVVLAARHFGEHGAS